jgi:hypothetical protein
MNSDFSAVGRGATASGGATVNRAVVYIRYLLQQRFDVPLSSRWTLELGSGIGAATGRVDQSCDSSGSVSCPIPSARRVWTGATWEFTPQIAYKLRDADVFVGVRYAGFPRFGGDDQIAPISWQTYGVTLGAAF